MADTVDTITLASGSKRVIRRFTNISDGTGESAVAKFDKSAFTNSNGEEPDRLDVEWIQWTIQGFVSVRLLWDHDTDDEVAVLAGNGYRDYREAGALKDPSSTGGTGDILLTTNGAVNGATYDILIAVKLSN